MKPCLPWQQRANGVHSHPRTSLDLRMSSGDWCSSRSASGYMGMARATVSVSDVASGACVLFWWS
jgi:hypothetical protein